MTKITRLAAAAVILGVGLGGCSTFGGGEAKPQTACVPQTVHIYFDADSAGVTDEARAVLQQAAELAKACRVKKVTVLGLADAAGAPDANLALSKQRADAVSKTLDELHLPSADFVLEAAGQSGAVNAAGDTRPLRRRADVTLDLSPRR
jgi:peptidoglycan-associated lipoprotein